MAVVPGYRHIRLSAREGGTDHLASSVHGLRVAYVTDLQVSFLRILWALTQDPASNWLLQKGDLLAHVLEKPRDGI